MRTSCKLPSIRRDEECDLEEGEFDDDLRDWDELGNYDLSHWPGMPGSVIENLANAAMDFGPVDFHYPNFPIDQTRLVESYQNYNWANSSPAMRDRQRANVIAYDAGNIFPFGSDSSNGVGFSSSPASIAPAAPGPVTGVLSSPSPTITNASHTRPWPCNICGHAVSFTRAPIIANAGNVAYAKITISATFVPATRMNPDSFTTLANVRGPTRIKRGTLTMSVPMLARTIHVVNYPRWTLVVCE
ncbi:hypothetical protein NPX13_g3639 [Xylaria arbuscula]|uniref:Uncharacterized protein n=1 Tax=Xylaria arbuscula TaxID=114810 RepID=A0A9W8NHI1_9PEZI|nr:hypothetical protein NPX13_g3639 [Xylaria arbuscula]